MKQDPNNQEAVVQGATDSEVELMLTDAYEVPAVPRTLLKRLDQAVEQEWGVSPELAKREPTPLGRVASRGSRLLKAWPIAASIALLVVAFAVFQRDAHAYSWAKMLDALSRMPAVEVAQNDGTTVRWMSIQEGIVGERSAERSWALDFGRGSKLVRNTGESQATRYTFASSTSTSREESVAMAFLLNNVEQEGTAVHQSNVRVLFEQWSRRGDDVVLDVAIGSPRGTTSLSIAIDPQTHLPKEAWGAGPEAGVLPLAFSESTVQFLQEDFPADLLVVDAVPPPTAVATDDTQPKPEAPEEAVAVAEDEPSAEEKPEKPEETVLVGAATLQWPAVKVTKLSNDEAVARINEIIEALWKEQSIEPAPAANDEELLRRVYLDLVGRTPSVSEARAYLDDESPDRYTKLVDQLLASRDHSTHLATVWRTYLIPEGIDLDRFGGPQSFEKWIGDQFMDKVPYDEIVRRLLLAEGRLSQSGPLLFYAAVKMDPDQLATRSARVFLGMRLDCAQCHDDKFEPWLQDDFWGYAAFFAQISRPQGVLRDVSTVMRVRDNQRGEVTIPETEDVVLPRFLDGSPIDNDAASVARRTQLAEWLTAAENPYFARATANRIWGQLFGKGIVDPVDGFGIQHEPVSQELLDEVAGHFIASDYDLRELFRTLVLSRAYRLSSGAETPDPKRHELFAQMNVKLLTAEQMYDCITVASMLGSAEAGMGFNLDRVGNTTRDQFLQQFRSPPGRSTEYQAGIPQALTLMNGGLISNATGLASSGLLKTLEVPLITNKDRVEILYLATLSRKPAASEQELLSEYITDDASGAELYEGLADVLWALLNSAEFTMNH